MARDPSGDVADGDLESVLGKMKHRDAYPMGTRSALAPWLELETMIHGTALIRTTTRCYEVRPVVPCLSKGTIKPNAGVRMKPSNRIMEIIRSRLNMENGADLTAADVTEIEGLTKVIDKRDQQKRKARKPAAKKAPAKKAARKR